MWVETTDDGLVIGVTLNAPAERVWGALTAPADLERWWGPQLRLDARDGGALLERWVDGDGRAVTTRGRVTRFEPQRRLALSWADEDWLGETGVDFRLEKDGARTWLRLEHRGWNAMPAPRRAALIGQHATGWQRRLAALAAFLGR